MGWFPCECCETCEIVSASFDVSDTSDLSGVGFTEVSGAWEVAGNLLKCTTAGLAICTTTHTGAVIVEGKLRGTNTGAKAAIVVDYVDTNNYHFVEIEFGFFSGTVRYFKRSGGTNTQLGGDLGVGAAGASGSTVQFYVCCDAGYIALSFGSLTAGTVRLTTLHGGSGFGFASQTPGASGVTFNDFRADRLYHAADDPTCPRCGRTCGACTDNSGPLRMKVVVAGVANQDCTSCASWNATYIVPFSSATAGEDGSCVWSLFTSVQHCPPGPDSRIEVIAELASGPDYQLTTKLISDYFSVDESYNNFTESYGGSNVPCNDLEDLSVAYTSHSSSLGGHACDGSAATVEVTALL